MATQKNRIPKGARRVYKGIMWDVYHWKQRLFDGSYAVYEEMRRLDTVIVIPTMNGKVILTIEEQPRVARHIGLVAGKVEREERPVNAAKRELLEEIGLGSDEWELLEARDATDTGEIEWRVYTYVARNCRKIAEPKLEAGEKIKTMPIDFERLMSLPGESKGLHHAFADFLNRIKSTRNGTAQFRRKLFGG
jgi:8-oxo-dGTP pyrophosphatase MutT (NUDIX family)